jgi:hypothetical protein
MTEHGPFSALGLPTVEEVAACWQRNGLKRSSSVQYQHWVRRYLAACARKHASPLIQLTSIEVHRFATGYARRRQIDVQEARRQAQQALRAWSVGLAGLGVRVPAWAEPKIRRALSGPWFGEYREFRHVHSSAQDRSIDRDLVEVAAWLRFRRSRKQKLRAVRISDIDGYLLHLRRRLAVATVPPFSACHGAPAVRRGQFSSGCASPSTSTPARAALG